MARVHLTESEFKPMVIPYDSMLKKANKIVT